MRTKDIYEATQWEPGDVITSQRMQKIEDELEKHSKTMESTLDNSVWIHVKDTETVVQVPTYEEILTPKELNWSWEIGTISTSTGIPTNSSIRIRTYHIPIGKGTKFTSSASGYRSLWIFIYDTNWNFIESTSSWTNEWIAESDCWVRIIMRAGGSDPEITDIAAVSSMLSCPNYVAPAFQIPDEFYEYNWVMGALSSGSINPAETKALVTQKILYAFDNLAINYDPNDYQACVAWYNADGGFISQSVDNIERKGMICIPKGIYYRIRIKSTNTSLIANMGFLSHFTIHKIVGDWWYGAQSLGENRFLARSNMIITPSIHISGHGLTVRCINSNYEVSWNDYDSDNPDAMPVRRGDWASKVHINPGCFYRLMIKWTDPSPVSGQESIVSIDAALKQLVIERAEDVDLGIAAAGIAALTTVEHGEIPSYYTYADSTHNSYMAEKAAAINNLYSNTRVQFAFITDYHVNGYTSRGGQTGHSDTLLKYLADNTLVNMCVNGGDVVNEGSGWTGTVQNKVEFRNLMRDTCAKLRVPGMVTYFVAGNHDGGTHGGSGKAKLITAEELYAVSGLQALRGHVIVDQTCPLQYYWDDTVHNIRYIVGALGLNNNAGNIENPNCGTIVTEQTTEEAFAFIAAALRTAPANCGIIIFNHMIIQTATGKTISNATTPYTNITLLADLVDAYNARNSDYKVGSYTTSQSNFSNCTGRVLAIIGGHSHIDYSYTTTNGVPIIVTTTDNAGGQLMLDNNNNNVINAQRIDGNTTDFTVEQAFDVFTVDVPTGQIWATRIGAPNTDPAFYVNNEYVERSWNILNNNS